MSFAKYLRTHFLKNTSEQLLLDIKFLSSDFLQAFIFQIIRLFLMFMSGFQTMKTRQVHECSYRTKQRLHWQWFQASVFAVHVFPWIFRDFLKYLFWMRLHLVLVRIDLDWSAANLLMFCIADCKSVFEVLSLFTEMQFSTDLTLMSTKSTCWRW